MKAVGGRGGGRWDGGYEGWRLKVVGGRGGGKWDGGRGEEMRGGREGLWDGSDGLRDGIAGWEGGEGGRRQREEGIKNFRMDVLHTPLPSFPRNTHLLQR